METFKGNTSNPFTNICKGILLSLVITFILLLIFSAILTYTGVNENTMSPVIITVTAISILISSSIGNIKIKRNGIINGGIIGGGYILLLYLISSILNWRFGLNIESLIMIVIGIAFGIIGGIIGVNKR